MIQDIASFLKTTQVFKKAPVQLLQRLEGKVEFHTVEAGEFLLREGDEVEGLFVVYSGRLRFYRHQQGKVKTLGEVRRGQTIGEYSLLTGEPYFASVQAIRESVVLQISRPQLFRILRASPDTMLAVSRALVGQFRRALEERPLGAPISTIAVLSLLPKERTKEFLENLRQSLHAFGSVELIDSSYIERVLGKEYVQAPRNSYEGLTLVKWLNMREQVSDFLIYPVEPELEEWGRRALRQADLIITVADFDSEPQLSKAEETFLYHKAHPLKSRRFLVLLHDQADWPKETSRWLEPREVDFHFHLHFRERKDFLRLARIVSGNSVSLVLGGGGARGFAHIGIVKAMEELGIPIDMIFGCSMGAIIGAQVAAGWEPDKIRQVMGMYVRGRGVLDYTLPMVSFLAGEKLTKTIRMLSEGRSIEDLWLTFFCNTVNMNTAQQVVHRRGELWRALRGAISLPALLPPVKIEGDWHLDGGIVNNLPADLMAEIQPQGDIIAVDVSVYDEFHHTEELEYISGWKVLWKKLLPFADPVDMPSIIDTINRTIELPALLHRAELFRTSPMSLYLRPPVEDFSLLEIEKVDKIVERGYQYGLERLSSWREGRSFGV